MFTRIALTAALALALAPAAHAAPAPCPANGASGWSAISVSGWITSAEGLPYSQAPQFVAEEFAALMGAVDRDADGVVCRKFGVLNPGRPPFVWPGYTPISFVDDLRVS